MIKEEEITSNINTSWEISQSYLKESRYGLCRYISEICQSIKTTFEVCSISMSLTNYFFIKNCYLNYQKLPLACAAILISSKKENAQNKINEISKEYFNINQKLSNQPREVLNADTHQKIKDKICEYELILLKSINFELSIELPYDFINVYSSVLYPDNDSDVMTLGTSIANDSFFTYANNVFKNYVVAISCIIIAAKFLDLPSILDCNFKYINNLKDINVKGISESEFEKKLLSESNIKINNEGINEANLDDGKNGKDKGMDIDKDEDEGTKYFKGLDVIKRLHPFMDKEDLKKCIKMIMEFYEDAKNNAGKGIN